MRKSLIFFFLSTLFSISTAVDTINRTQSIKDNGESLVSSGEVFELGFFSPGNSKNRYLGIRYKKIPVENIVWVANRDKPLTNSGGILTFAGNGELVLNNSTGDVVWSTNVFTNAPNLVLRLLNSGNLVIIGDDDQNFLWQSFDQPINTLLPGMKIGVSKKTNMSWYLTAWKNSDDPSPGNYTLQLDTDKLPQLLLIKGSSTVVRSGPWNGLRFSGMFGLNIDFLSYGVVSNEDEVYYAYNITRAGIFSRLVLNSSGGLARQVWNNDTGEWKTIWSAPGHECNRYGNCGPHGTCNVNVWPPCWCLRGGFVPRSPEYWSLRDWTGGCMRKVNFKCGINDGFLRLGQVKLPDMKNATVNVSMSLEECKGKCERDCSCTAYAAADIRDGGRGCITWVGDLIDMMDLPSDGQEMFLRVAASELDPTINDSKDKKKTRVIVATVVSGTMFLLLSGCSIWRIKKKKMIKKKKKKMTMMKKKKDQEGTSNHHSQGSSHMEEQDLPLFDFEAIASATNNFSDGNKIGKGGFGVVYKGTMEDGQEIAVKRLSLTSAQGLSEFMNEAILIAKLQHRNLVRLLGCCIQGEEKMLIYEYMQNKSLDQFIFDQSKRAFLNWRMRLNIILGIARGVLYLHHDSRLRIIHRDLKAGNILLDREMNPKISDFGTARVFGADQKVENTKRVIGTHGYMSPEYAIDGVISIKSDVFSFGVIILELISGTRNQGIYLMETHLNLLSHTWKLWTEGNCMELLDKATCGSCPVTEVLRCVHVGLLCVQEFAVDRPTMSSVVTMLDSETFPLPQPKKPGFLVLRSPTSTKEFSSMNEVTITSMDGR